MNPTSLSKLEACLCAGDDLLVEACVPPGSPLSKVHSSLRLLLQDVTVQRIRAQERERANARITEAVFKGVEKNQPSNSNAGSRV